MDLLRRKQITVSALTPLSMEGALVKNAPGLPALYDGVVDCCRDDDV